MCGCQQWCAGNLQPDSRKHHTRQRFGWRQHLEMGVIIQSAPVALVSHPDDRLPPSEKRLLSSTYSGRLR